MGRIKKLIINKKNIIILLITVVLSFFSMINFSIALYANNDVEIVVELNKDDRINEIVVSKNVLSLSDLKNENILLENVNDNKSSLKVLVDTTLSLNISVIDDVNINLTSIDNKVCYSINGEEFNVDGNCVSIYNSDINIIKNSLNINSIIIFIVSFFVIFICVYLINYTLITIDENKVRIWNIPLFLISIFLIYLSNIYLFMMINKILAIIPAIFISMCILIHLKFSIKEWQNIFLCISAVIGVMMIFIITPGNVPDEPSHYTRTYVDSVAFSKNIKNEVKMPDSLNLLLNKFTHDVHSLTIKYSGKSYMTELVGDNNYTKLCDNIASYENTKYLSFLPYLPSTIINLLSRCLKLPVLLTFLLCRLINLIISTILCYYAIKTTPNFKKVFALIATLPIFLQQAAAINMDFLTNSVAFLFIATVLKYRFNDEKLNIKDLFILSCEGIALSLCKFGYFPLLLLILLISNKKFNNKKVAIIFKISLVVFLIIISYFANFTIVSNPNTNTEDMYTIKTVILNPINSAKICFKTFVTRFVGDTFSNLIDSFGWSTKYQLEFSLWTVGAIYIIMVFIDNEEGVYLSKKDRIIMLSVFSIIYSIIYCAAFTEWTSITSDKINGIQSRYFIPILPLFYIAISNNFFKINIKDKWKLYSILVFVAHILTCISIVNAFY